MPVGNYLHGLEFQGRNLLEGPYDIAGGKPYELYGASSLLARSLREAYGPQGILAPITSDIFFGGLASGAVQRQREFERQQSAALAQAGVSPTRALGIIEESRAGTQGPLGDILGQRAQIQYQRAKSEQDILSQFASAQAGLATNAKSLQLTYDALKEAKKQNKFNRTISIIGTALELVPYLGDIFKNISTLFTPDQAGQLQEAAQSAAEIGPGVAGSSALGGAAGGAAVTAAEQGIEGQRFLRDLLGFLGPSALGAVGNLAGGGQQGTTGLIGPELPPTGQLGPALPPSVAATSPTAPPPQLPASSGPSARSIIPSAGIPAAGAQAGGIPGYYANDPLLQLLGAQNAGYIPQAPAAFGPYNDPRYSNPSFIGFGQTQNSIPLDLRQLFSRTFGFGY